MKASLNSQSLENLERLTGIVERVTYHNEQNGWSVLKFSPFREATQVTVLIHQAKVFAGATMEFWGTWGHHPKYGNQFKAVQAVEKKPASSAALEKYLGSGLIAGVGPATAKRIVGHFKDRTLEVFESSIDELTSVPGIAEKKLEKIKDSWNEHRAIRDVMIFLQGHGISTLYATKIYKTYGDQAIAIVSENPYRLAQDIYGIGFFSADKVALAMGFARQGEPRIEAGIKHVLAASRDNGHCYLKEQQIQANTLELLAENIDPEKITAVLHRLLDSRQVMLRQLKDNESGELEDCYYSKTLYFDELKVAEIIGARGAATIQRDPVRMKTWIEKYCEKHQISLSDEQLRAVQEIPLHPFTVLTGGPGCGKTTCTNVLVQLLKAMKVQVTLAAPTGRAAQRMTEVIGDEAKTIHRLLGWAPQKNGFKKDEEDPIETDFLILDETSMLDISLAASLLKAVPATAQILFIGDPDQLPAVGAGRVLEDLLESEVVPTFRLTKVFRQAQASSIIRFAHEINSGRLPLITSPLVQPNAFEKGIDCLFVDADEATQDQLRFIHRVKLLVEQNPPDPGAPLSNLITQWGESSQRSADEGNPSDQLFQPKALQESEARQPLFTIPDKFRHVDLAELVNAKSGVEELAAVLRKVHPWSSIKYGLTALETALRLYTKSIPGWLGPQAEIQILTPQVRGSMGTRSLNEALQRVSNPEAPHKAQLFIGGKLLRVGDRVIQTRNNYDLGIFNGDIGRVTAIDTTELLCSVLFAGPEQREVVFKREDLTELQLAYAITVHKSQGSEFEAVIIPVLGQHFNMLFRNLIYTGLTRAKKLAVFVGSRKALAMAVQQIDNRKRQTALSSLLVSKASANPPL